MGYLYIFLTLTFTVYGQVILKWRLNQFDYIPDATVQKFVFLIKSLFDPFIFSSFFAAFLGSLTWMAALKEFELSKAYPFMSLSFICVLIISTFLLNESVNFLKVAGSIFIIVGIILIAKAS